MFFFYVLSFVKKGDTIQEGTLFKGGHYLRKNGSQECTANLYLIEVRNCRAIVKRLPHLTLVYSKGFFPRK